MEGQDGRRRDAIPYSPKRGDAMNSKTLENLVRQAAPSTQPPLETWKQRRRGKRDYRPCAAALVRRATLDAGVQAAEGWG